MEKLIIEHIALARSMAIKFYNRRKNMGLELDDFISAAMLGLCESAKSFQAEKGKPFAPYAYFRIRGAMYDIIRANSNVPRGMYCEISAEKSRYRVARDLHELASLQTIIEEYGIKMIFGAEPLPEIAYYREQNPEEATAFNEATSYIRNLLSDLSSERRQVLAHYYYEEKTYREIEPLIEGSSKSWICRLHKSALASMRSVIEANSMKWDLQSAFGR